MKPSRRSHFKAVGGDDFNIFADLGLPDADNHFVKARKKTGERGHITFKPAIA